MKRAVLALLLSAFVFVTVHDWVIESLDYDTQHELMLVEHGELQTSAMCDVSEVHQHLHESIISYKIVAYKALKRVGKKQSSFIFKEDIPLSHMALSIYRPPIV